jgi:hypothetical protein
MCWAWACEECGQMARPVVTTMLGMQAELECAAVGYVCSAAAKGGIAS